MRLFLYFLCMLPIVLISCHYNREHAFLHNAGSNRHEIEKAIDYFKEEHKDSLKLEALYYLLENIATQQTEYPVITDSLNRTIRAIGMDKLPADTIFMKQLITAGEHLSIKEVATIQKVKSSYLINTINLAFESWKKYPWNSNIPFEDFLSNVLPFNIYRNDLDNWREIITVQNKTLLDSLANAGVVKPAKVYRAILSSPDCSQVKYAQKYIRFTNYPSYSEILYSKKADCFNLACLYAYLLRAAGIPATIDIVPSWGTENGGHSEVVFLHETGKYSPDDVNRFNRACKIYRYVALPVPLRIDTSELNRESIRQIPAHLLNSYLQDVTSSYVVTNDVTVSIPDSLHSKVAFICVQNFLRWQPVEAALIKDGSVTFKNMNRKVFYQIAIPAQSGNLYLIDRPFILNEQGVFVYKNADPSTLITLQLKQVNSFEWNNVIKGRNYMLQYLDNHSWNTIAEKQAVSDTLLTFTNVPSNGVYRLLEDGDRRMISRCFTYEGNKQIWW